MSEYESVGGGSLKFKGGGITKKYDLMVFSHSFFPLAPDLFFTLFDSIPFSRSDPPLWFFGPVSNRKKKKTDTSKVVQAVVEAREGTPPPSKPIKVAERTAAEIKFLEVQRKRVSTLALFFS